MGLRFRKSISFAAKVGSIQDCSAAEQTGLAAIRKSWIDPRSASRQERMTCWVAAKATGISPFMRDFTPERWKTVSSEIFSATGSAYFLSILRKALAGFACGLISGSYPQPGQQFSWITSPSH